MHITSLQNPRIKSILRLKAESRERRRDGLMLVEGIDEIELALSSGHHPTLLVSAPQITRRELREAVGQQLTVTGAIFEKLSVREKPDGWLALFHRPSLSLDALSLPSSPLFLALEDVEKPGNLGAMLRTADAAGVDAVVICDPRADVFGPNVVRASRGALFSVPVIESTSADAIMYLRQHGVRIVAANPNSGAAFQEANLVGSLAIAMGTEDAGLSDMWLQHADLQVRIPMEGRVNSLNVSVAAALLLYEARRQRAVWSRL